MACEQTEYRLLLHAHNELGAWERWGMTWHLRRCPCCREARDGFERERWALADCLSSPLVREPATHLAPHLAAHAPVSLARRSPLLRSPALLLALLVLLMAGTALAYVEMASLPGGAFYHAQQSGGCLPGAGVSRATPAAARTDDAITPSAVVPSCDSDGAHPATLPAATKPQAKKR